MVEGGGRDGGDKARDEFLSEAQELVDGLGRDLIQLNEGLKRGKVDAELINVVFRAVHTLKGLSGLFGATRLAGLSPRLADGTRMAGFSLELEGGLDGLRLGRAEISQSVLDMLFQAVSLYSRILSAE